MDKGTLSHYGWIVIMVLTLSVLLALGTPFGKYIGRGISVIANGFVNSSKQALSDDNLDKKENEWDSILNDNENNHNAIVPEGGTYYVGVTSVVLGDYTGYTEKYEAGEKFPSKVQYGDVYVFGDYEYRYSYTFEARDDMIWLSNDETSALTYTRSAQKDTVYFKDGWGARVIDKNKEKYENPLTYINKKAVSNFSCTYAKCKKLINAPQIPETAIEMYSTFAFCSLLEDAPDLSKCKKLNCLRSAFTVCHSLIDVENINIPNTKNNINMYETFANCYSMKQAPIIPENVTKTYNLFYDCRELTGTVVLNMKNITELEQSKIFNSTEKPIIITGMCPYLNEIAEKFDNVSVG